MFALDPFCHPITTVIIMWFTKDSELQGIKHMYILLEGTNVQSYRMVNNLCFFHFFHLYLCAIHPSLSIIDVCHYMLHQRDSELENLKREKEERDICIARRNKECVRLYFHLVYNLCFFHLYLFAMHPVLSIIEVCHDMLQHRDSEFENINAKTQITDTHILLE